jgi:N-acetylglucosaminyldiphosphoundecaprenol N-acetyl-beta-D-mannosaminyltransferase
VTVVDLARCQPGLNSRAVLDVRVDATSYIDAVRCVKFWARRAESRYVCASNVHMVMEAHDDLSFREVVLGADLVTPDGVPLVWALRLMGVRDATRVYGPNLMLELCAMAARDAIPVGLHGSEPVVLNRLRAHLCDRFSDLQIVYAEAPPFGPEPDEEARIEQIRASGARILFVALGGTSPR